jgi:hypothetical protein
LKLAGEHAAAVLSAAAAAVVAAASPAAAAVGAAGVSREVVGWLGELLEDGVAAVVVLAWVVLVVVGLEVLGEAAGGAAAAAAAEPGRVWGSPPSCSWCGKRGWAGPEGRET